MMASKNQIHLCDSPRSVLQRSAFSLLLVVDVVVVFGSVGNVGISVCKIVNNSARAKTTRRNRTRFRALENRVNQLRCRLNLPTKIQGGRREMQQQCCCIKRTMHQRMARRYDATRTTNNPRKTTTVRLVLEIRCPAHFIFPKTKRRRSSPRLRWCLFSS